MSGPFSLSMYAIVFSLSLLVNVFSATNRYKCFTDFRAEPLRRELTMFIKKTTPKTIKNMNRDTNFATVMTFLEWVRVIKIMSAGEPK